MTCAAQEERPENGKQAFVSGREQAWERELQLGKGPSRNQTLNTGLAGLESVGINLGQAEARIRERKWAHRSANLPSPWLMCFVCWVLCLLSAPPGLPSLHTWSRLSLSLADRLHTLSERSCHMKVNLPSSSFLFFFFSPSFSFC